VDEEEAGGEAAGTEAVGSEGEGEAAGDLPDVAAEQLLAEVVENVMIGEGKDVEVADPQGRRAGTVHLLQPAAFCPHPAPPCPAPPALQIDNPLVHGALLSALQRITTLDHLVELYSPVQPSELWTLPLAGDDGKGGSAGGVAAMPSWQHTCHCH
jgi:hypothetical protein